MNCKPLRTLAPFSLFPLVLLLAAASPRVAVLTDYGQQIEQIVREETAALSELQAAYEKTTDVRAARRIRDSMDLVKRSTELGLFRLQLLRAEAQGTTEHAEDMRSLIRSLDAELQRRSELSGVARPRIGRHVLETARERS